MSNFFGWRPNYFWVGLATLSISAVGLLMQAFKEKYDFTERVEQSKFAYKTYTTPTNAIRGLLRGRPYDNIAFISKLSSADEMVVDVCVPLSEKMKRRYDKTYGEST